MREVIDFAREIFDTVGVVIEDKRTFLILGLVSKPDRDLDTFISDGRRWEALGFKKYFTPKVKTIIQKLKGEGFFIKQKRYSDLNIKEMAVRAGIGCWGKNSLVIHPKFGPWLRFVALETNAPLEPSISEIQNDLCGQCDICLRNCPVEGLLEPYKLIDATKCLAYIQLENPTTEPTPRCNSCLACCPIGLSWR